MVIVAGADIGAAFASGPGAEGGAGLFVGADVGLGYAFIDTRDFFLSVAALGGMSVILFPYDEYAEEYPLEAYASSLNVNVGADIFASVRLSGRLGLFAGIKVMYSTELEIGGGDDGDGRRLSPEDGYYSLRGLSLRPSVGLSVYL